MKNITLKIAAVWLAYACILIWFIYRIQGESVILFPTDVKYLFVLNRRTLYAIVLCLAIMMLFCLYAVMNAKEKIRFRWDIRIGKRRMKLGELKLFYSKINLIPGGGTER